MARVSGNTKAAFEYGSAAREYKATMPVRKPEWDEQDRLEKQRKEELKHLHRLNRHNILYTVFVATVAVVIFGLSYQFLNLQTEVKKNAETIKELQVELNTIKDNNNIEEAQLEASIDYNAVFDIAINELGMKYPNRNQVVSFEAGESEYVMQYKSVPEN